MSDLISALHRDSPRLTPWACSSVGCFRPPRVRRRAATRRSPVPGCARAPAPNCCRSIRCSSEYPFAFLGLAQPRLLRRRELPLFQRFEIAVRGHALGFAAIDDGFGFPRIVRLAFEERDGPADQAFTVCAKRCQRLLSPAHRCSRSRGRVPAMAASSFSLKLCISSRCRVRMWSVCRRCSSCCCAF